MNIKESLLALLLALFPGAAAELPAPAPLYDVSGNYVLSMEYEGNDYLHDLTVTQDADGDLSGTGGSPSGAHVYTWTIVDGKVVGNDIDFTAVYTETADAVTPLTTLTIDGEIASNGTLSGTWSDNYQGGSRSGSFETASGTAVEIETPENVTLNAEDFSVVSYDTGLGILKGYSAGFGLNGETFNDVESVVVKLYAGSKLLQTNTATDKLMNDITGSQVSSPFDVSGNFNYSTDGFWNNDREREYGQTKAATRVVATVTLEDGTVLTAVNTTLSGDARTIMPDLDRDDDEDEDDNDEDDDEDKPEKDKDKNKDKDECKKGGWKAFTNSIFKNQGQCVSNAARN